MTSPERAALAAIPLELERIRTQFELMAGLAETDRGKPLQGARPVPATRPLVWGGSGRLVGWSLRAIDPLIVRLFDSRDATGDVIAVINLAAGASSTHWLGPGGVSFTEGLYLTPTIPGQFEGSVWLGAVD